MRDTGLNSKEATRVSSELRLWDVTLGFGFDSVAYLTERPCGTDFPSRACSPHLSHGKITAPIWKRCPEDGERLRGKCAARRCASSRRSVSVTSSQVLWPHSSEDSRKSRWSPRLLAYLLWPGGSNGPLLGFPYFARAAHRTQRDILLTSLPVSY